jgi:phage shock protein PspC (stress-responsive transcriptional regulator)
MAKTNHTPEDTSPNFSSLRRSSTNKVLAGVAGGLGEFFNIDPTIIRIIFILLTVFSGSGILIYLILWLIMPSDKTTSNLNNNRLRENASEISDQARSFAHNLSFNGKNREDSRFWWGLIIIIFGFLALFHNFGLFEIFSIGKLWPIILVIIGIMILNRRKN